MKNSNRRELQNVAINHSADINYNNFVKIYGKCRREPFFFRQLVLRYQQAIF